MLAINNPDPPDRAVDAAPAPKLVKPPRVGDLLLERGIVSTEQVEQALDFQRSAGKGKLLGEVLVELGFVTEQQVMEVLAESYGVPFVQVTPRLADPKVIEVLGREFCDKHGVLPLFSVNGTLTVAVSEPANLFLPEECAKASGQKVQLVASPEADIRQTLETHVPDGNVFVIDEVMDDLADADLAVVDHDITDLEDAGAAAGESPVIKLVNLIVYEAVQEGTSDIHIEPGERALRVRYRVDGRLFEKLSPPPQMHAAIASRIKIMASLDISERRQPQDGGITIMLARRQIDLRVSTMPSKYGEKVVMRIVDTGKAMANLDPLGMTADMLGSLRRIIRQPNGIMLVTGPTGSGKSTTLYAALSEINDPAVNISTVEDPVEQHLTGINQFQVNPKANFTFATALRALLRQDPDVLMVGEVRDQDTAKIATQAALTGHLVLSTLHTNDAPSAVTRLINIGVEPYLIAAAVRGVLAQRLVRRVCKDCKELAPEDDQHQRTLERLAEEGHDVPDTLYQGVGCSTCRHTGYKGRAGVYELYEPSDEALDAISRGATLQELRQLAKAGGYTTLKHDGLRRVAAGETTLEELMSATAV